MHNQERILINEHFLLINEAFATKDSKEFTSTLKLTEPFLLINEAFATKDSKVGYVWFLPGDEFIWRFLEESVGIHSVAAWQAVFVEACRWRRTHA